MKQEIDEAVQYTGRGNSAKFNGQFPEKYVGLVSPSKDAFSFFYKKRILEMENFCLPDLYVVYPEAMFRNMYSNCAPPCKWCKSSECVVRDGWMQLPRRGHSRTRNVAILGRRYYCSVRKKAGLPYNFRGIDKEVIDSSPDYVQMIWRMHGFDLSHKSAIYLPLLREMRSAVVQGLSVNGFRNVLIQQLREYHLMVSIQWRSYVDHIRKNPPIMQPGTIEAMMKDFVEFDSDEYDQTIPSLSWLIQRMTLLMESDETYKKRRMQMVDGKHLSGDHSFKLTKCVTSGGSKPFTAIYCLMNEFGQVVAWWFTSGTSMTELESAIAKIKHRYKLYGYDGPHTATTDRCCQERAFWIRVLRLIESRIDTQYLETEDVSEIEVVKAPFEGQIASTIAICVSFVGWISDELNKLPPEQRVIAVDGEWKIGHAKMDLLMICMPFSYKVYVFQLTQMCNNKPDRFPRVLKLLLQDPSVKKVGNRICSDVLKLKGWGVELKPTVELGHLAADRAVVSSRGASLADIIESLFPGVELEGKDGGPDSPRTSNWSVPVLTQKQKEYADKDAYTTAVGWRRLMQIMNPKIQARLLKDDVVEGLKVTFYSNKWKCRVVEGTAHSLAKNKLNLKIDILDDATIFAPGTLVDVVGSDATITRRTIASLQQQYSTDETELSNTVTIQCPLYFCRRTLNESGTDERIQINTETKQVLVDEERYNEIQYQQYDADDERDNSILNQSDSESSAGEGDRVARLPRNRRRRKYFYRRQRVKNDIVHLFFRFQRVISKEHGAYFSFIAALRDAFFILNQKDLDECFQVLRDKCKLSDEEIYKKMKYNFLWFLKRVRLHVPEPPVLEKRYMEVYNQFQDICCAKTGKKLFNTKEAQATHISALKHIRRNCVSDMPFETYYTPVRKDRHGLTIYRCHRGTPGNEGIHQKIRQLVRGFNNSPRLMYAMLSDYFLIWNQNIDITLRGLPSKYDGIYCGDLLEAEIEKMTAWKQRDTPPHPEWMSTRSVECSDEVFGFLLDCSAQKHSAQIQTNCDDDSVSSCGSIISDAENAADQLCDIEDGGDEVEVDMATRLQPSAQWMAQLHGKYRPYGKVLGNIEWEYFKSNVTKFQGRDSDEADNFSSIRWSAFAQSWNKWVDGLGTRHSEVTYKSSSYLKDAFKSMQKRALQSSTLRPHKQTLDNLRERHTNEATNRTFIGEFEQAEKAAPIRPQQSAISTALRGTANNDDSDSIASQSEYGASFNISKRRRMHRCRRCGKYYALPEWLPFHKNKILDEDDNKLGKYLRNGEGNKVWEMCTVDPADFEVGFPCSSKRLPKVKRKKHKK